jgi:excinuclease ABC subunit B
LYADRVTGSMQRAIEETDRRRHRQVAFNELHGIVPRGISKAVFDVMEGARAEPADQPAKAGRRAAPVAPSGNVVLLAPEQIARDIKRLEADMFKRARNLEFEEAAKLRDQIEKLKQAQLGLLGAAAS